MFLTWSSGFVFLMVSLHTARGQGEMDPCYFWPGAVYAGDGMCFLSVNSAKDFNESQIACEADGGSLAEVKTIQQRNTARQLISSLGTAWLGAWDSLLDGNFSWVSDGDPVSVPLAWWSNSRVPENLLLDLCLVMTTASVFDVLECDNTAKSICQIYAGNPCDSYLPGADYHDDSCFLPISEETTFDEARKECGRVQSILAEPKDRGQIGYLNMIADELLDSSKTAWIGVHSGDRPSSMGWVTSGDPVTTDNWSQGEPPLRSYTPDDAVVLDGPRAWQWKVVSKSSLAQAVCQRDISDACSGLFILGRCFIFYSEMKTWFQARDDCISKDSYLAEPKTEVLSRAVDKYLLEHTSASAVLLGGHDVDNEGQYVWDHSGENFTFTDWHQGEPNNHGGREHYLVWRKNFKWNDTPGSSRSRYLCERIVKAFFHSYVVVIPKNEWGGWPAWTIGLLSVSSQPGFEDENPVEISTFPSGQLQSRTLVGVDVFQYMIDVTPLHLDSSGPQHKYVLVKSLLPLDVLFFFHGKTQYACASLVFETLPAGRSSSFFSLSRLKDNSIGVISTDEATSSLMASFSTFHQTLSFVFNGMEMITRNILTLSTSLTEQYQSLYVDSLTGAATPQLFHSTGPLAVFDFGREDWSDSRDVTCDQVMPTSMVGSDYVTFPSLPMDPDVIDYFTIVTVYGSTEISVYGGDNSTALKEVTLWWPGDSTQLQLPASGFYYVNGTRPFYLYTKITGADPTSSGRTGRCSVTLLHEGLFRTSYRLPLVGPMTGASDMFVVVIVRTSDMRSLHIMVVEGGSIQMPDFCETVSDTKWSGCYFRLTHTTPGLVHRVQMDPTLSSPFGAYLVARLHSPKRLFCFHLGVPYLWPDDLGDEYDYSSYETKIKSKPICFGGQTPQPQQCPTPINKTQVVLTSAQLKESLEQITAHLTVEKSSLSSVKRAKESAPDKRASSSSMGYFSLIFIVVFLGLVVISDFRKLFLDLRIAQDNLRLAF